MRFKLEMTNETFRVRVNESKIRTRGLGGLEFRCRIVSRQRSIRHRNFLGDRHTDEHLATIN